MKSSLRKLAVSTIVVLVLLIVYFVWGRLLSGGAREQYMTGYYIFPQTPGEGYPANEDPYPLQYCDPDSTPLAKSGAMYDGYYHGGRPSSNLGGCPPCAGNVTSRVSDNLTGHVSDNATGHVAAPERFSAPYFGGRNSAYQSPLEDPLKRAKYGDRSPLCGPRCARPPQTSDKAFCRASGTCSSGVCPSMNPRRDQKSCCGPNILDTVDTSPCITAEALDRYYGAEYGWNYSFYY